MTKLLKIASPLKWPLYLLGAYVTIEACLRVWWCDDRCIYMICKHGLRVDFADGLVVENNGGLVFVLLAVSAPILAILTACLSKLPKGLVFVTALAQSTLALSLIQRMRRFPALPITSTATGIMPNRDSLNRVLYGSLLILLAAIWDLFASRQQETPPPQLIQKQHTEVSSDAD